MPWCQWRRGNIIVDFFTTKASERTNDALDRFGAVLLAICFALLAWRTTLGGLNAYDTHSESQMLGFPLWVVYVAMVPPFVLAAVIGAWQAVFGFPSEAPEAHA
jgi:TRAP-type C4-dicarboxylate transport system permease small subunit